MTEVHSMWDDDLLWDADGYHWSLVMPAGEVVDMLGKAHAMEVMRRSELFRLGREERYVPGSLQIVPVEFKVLSSDHTHTYNLHSDRLGNVWTACLGCHQKLEDESD